MKRKIFYGFMGVQSYLHLGRCSAFC